MDRTSERSDIAGRGLAAARRRAAVYLLLYLLYRQSGRIGRSAAVVLFVVLTAGYMARVDRLEKRWDEFTMMYREIVRTLVEGADEFPGIGVIAVEDPPMAFRYLVRAARLERPEILLVEVSERKETQPFRPCLHVTYSGDMPKIMRMEMLE